jgi:hypothetical protein
MAAAAACDLDAGAGSGGGDAVAQPAIAMKTSAAIRTVFTSTPKEGPIDR